MGTEEDQPEPAAQQPPREPGQEEEEAPTGDSSQPLNTYQWHTGSRGHLGPREEASPTSTLARIQKASSSKWSKMQNWRKALSEEQPDKSCSPGRSGAARKNPFRRALSEPLGSRLAALTPSSGSAAPAPAADPAEASGASTSTSTADADGSQRGGSRALLRKYLWTVSRKLKRPRLQSRSSSSNLLAGRDPGGRS